MKTENFPKKQLLLALALALALLVSYGCDGVCQESVAVSNTIGARLYYPCDISAAVPATSMTSGYAGTYAAIEWLSRQVAEAGFIVLAATPTNMMGTVSGWKQAHKSCIAKLIDLNETHSVLKGYINTAKLQTCGHSKGGGGSLWASSELMQTLKSTIGMAPFREEFQESALSAITAATLIQAGSMDSVAIATMTIGQYNALPNIQKAYICYSGTGHSAWSNGGSNQIRLAKDIIAWMKYYLNDDTSVESTIANTARTTKHTWVK